MRGGVLLIALAGCDYTFNLDHISSRAGDAQADAFDPARQCPAAYTLELYAGSRFRIIDTPLTAWAASDDCIDDSAGLSHLANAPGRAKLDALIAAMTARQEPTFWWIGAVQPVAVTTPLEGWIWMNGEPVDVALWNMPYEPNDGEGTETDHQEQFSFIDSADPGLVDVEGLALGHALCECDGQPTSMAARVAIDQGRR